MCSTTENRRSGTPLLHYIVVFPSLPEGICISFKHREDCPSCSSTLDRSINNQILQSGLPSKYQRGPTNQVLPRWVIRNCKSQVILCLQKRKISSYTTSTCSKFQYKHYALPFEIWTPRLLNRCGGDWCSMVESDTLILCFRLWPHLAVLFKCSCHCSVSLIYEDASMVKPLGTLCNLKTCMSKWVMRTLAWVEGHFFNLTINCSAA